MTAAEVAARLGDRKVGEREMNDELTLALRLRERGLSVIPVPRPDATHSGKKPLIHWREYQTRLPTVAELTRWFATPMNLAVITGIVSNIVVIDADAIEALGWCTAHLPYTPWQTKTSKGFHLWYRHPGGAVRNRARVATDGVQLSLDVRGDGGYVIAPGSVHARGALYEFAGDWTREDVPRFRPSWLQGPTPPPAPRPPTTRARSTAAPVDLIDRARQYLAAIPPPTIGAGSDVQTFYAACKLVRGFDLAVDDAELLLWEWAGNRAGWTPDWIAAKVAYALRYGTEPIGGLR